MTDWPMPRLRVIRDEDSDRPTISVRELERSIIDLAQDVAATCSMTGGLQAGITEEAVRALCDGVNDLNAAIVTQGCPPALPARADLPRA